MHPFIKFKKDLLRHGLEFFGLYYGTYEGVVSNVDDPDVRGRILIKCPAVYGNVEFPKWALPKGMFTGKNIGSFYIPPVGSNVWVEFKNGDPEYPLWSYGWYREGYAPEEAEPGKYLFITPAGYKLLLDDNNKLIKLYFDENREVLLDEEQTVLKSGDNTVTLKEKIKIEFGGVSMVDYLEELTTIVKDGIMNGSSGPYVWSPVDIVKFEKNIVELKKMME